MSRTSLTRTWTIVKREFVAFTHSKGYVAATLFGPVAALAFLFLPLLFERMSGDDPTRVAIVDASDAGLGAPVRRILEASEAGDPPRYRVEIVDPGEADPDAARRHVRARVAAGESDGLLWLPPEILNGERIAYEARDPGSRERAEIRAAVETAVRRARLAAAGIEPETLERAMASVQVSVGSPTDAARASTAPVSTELVMFSNFLLYMVVLLYGVAVLRGVREEKDDRIVELMLSSVRGRQLMAGKVFGIGLAGLLQVGIWVVASLLVLRFGRGVIEAFGATAPPLPDVPPGALFVFLVFFLGGYFLYASLFAALGSIATSAQEAQNLQWPAMFPLVVAFILGFTVMDDPAGTLAVVGTYVPFSTGTIVPVRAFLSAISWPGIVLAGAILALACLAMLWLAGKVYEVTILATGQRPSLGKLARWLREA